MIKKRVNGLLDFIMIRKTELDKVNPNKHDTWLQRKSTQLVFIARPYINGVTKKVKRKQLRSIQHASVCISFKRVQIDNGVTRRRHRPRSRAAR